MFQNNQRQFYRELNQEEERCDDDKSDAEEQKKFWGDIWSDGVNGMMTYGDIMVDCNRDAKSMLQNRRRQI